MAQFHNLARPRIPNWLRVILLVLAVGAVLVLLWRGPWVLDRAQLAHMDKDSGPKATVVTGLRTALAALVVAGAGAFGLYFTSQTLKVTQQALEHTRAKDRRQEELTREAQVTDRYVKAVGLLASDKLTERLGGVYALDRIMHDSEKDHETIVQLLAAFIRERAPRDPSTAAPDTAPDDVRAALTVLVHRPDRPERHAIDLSHSDLVCVELGGTTLRRVGFVGSRLDCASLSGTIFIECNLYQASLRGVVADGANFANAHLAEADLFRADLSSANLAGADLQRANLAAAFLRNANLDDTNLRDTRFFDPAGGDLAIVKPEQLVRAHIITGTFTHESLRKDPALLARIQECEKALGTA